MDCDLRLLQFHCSFAVVYDNLLSRGNETRGVAFRNRCSTILLGKTQCHEHRAFLIAVHLISQLRFIFAIRPRDELPARETSCLSLSLSLVSPLPLQINKSHLIALASRTHGEQLSLTSLARYHESGQDGEREEGSKLQRNADSEN